jgi:hypothetical protein
MMKEELQGDGTEATLDPAVGAVREKSGNFVRS